MYICGTMTISASPRLSITKWIHIHHGDDGIKRFFRKIFKALKPGGTFVLEPQEYSTYERRAKLLEVMEEMGEVVKTMKCS